MNTKDELMKILVNNAQSWNKEEMQDRAFIYVDDFLNEVESKFKLLPIPDVVGRSEQLPICSCENIERIDVGGGDWVIHCNDCGKNW